MCGFSECVFKCIGFINQVRLDNNIWRESNSCVHENYSFFGEDEKRKYPRQSQWLTCVLLFALAEKRAIYWICYYYLRLWFVSALNQNQTFGHLIVTQWNNHRCDKKKQFFAKLNREIITIGNLGNRRLLIAYFLGNSVFSYSWLSSVRKLW